MSGFAAKKLRNSGAVQAVATTAILLTAVGCAGPQKNAAAPAPRSNQPISAPSNTPSSTDGAKASKYQDAVAVSALREQALGILVEQATSGAPEVRVNAIEALSSVPRRVEPILRAALVDTIPALRITAAVVVGNTKLESSVSFVEPLLNDPLLPVRASAAYAMKRCGRDVNMGPLAELLADPSPRWRAHAAYLLGKLGDHSALPMLEEAVEDQFPRVSGSEIRIMELQVAQARVRLGDDEAIQSIRAALFPARSEDLEATALAAQLTGELNDRASARELVMLTRMRDDVGHQMPPEVRLAAAGSLASLRVEQASPESVAREFIADRTPTIRAQAAYVLGQTGRREALDLLAPLLTDQSEGVKVTAAAAITRISDPHGVSSAMR